MRRRDKRLRRCLIEPGGLGPRNALKKSHGTPRSISVRRAVNAGLVRAQNAIAAAAFSLSITLTSRHSQSPTYSPLRVCHSSSIGEEQQNSRSFSARLPEIHSFNLILDQQARHKHVRPYTDPASRARPAADAHRWHRQRHRTRCARERGLGCSGQCLFPSAVFIIPRSHGRMACKAPVPMSCHSCQISRVRTLCGVGMML
jgi:hypothetical protein